MREIGQIDLYQLLRDNQYPFGQHHQERLHTQVREETDWDDPLEQMIERAPHTITEADDTIIKHPTYVTDQKMFSDKLAELTCEYECWTYIKPHARARNGSEAYMAFKNHYLGLNNIGNMAATAEHK